MPAQLIVRAKEVRDDGSIVELVVWRLPQPLAPCQHFYKYRLYFGADGVCHVRYDNERGKGDHRHLNGQEAPYLFVSVERLLDDFQRDVETWRPAS
ncbi:MAG: toxin-antitoxin system TumE family protein [Pseudomonadota bacterium]